jgi:pyruvate dehydrogenase E1 component alpha subunit
VDGTDAVAVYRVARSAVERARSGAGPQALEAVTLRGHGHAAHDDARYVPAELRARFADPVERLAALLVADGVAEAYLDATRAAAAAEVAAALEEAEAAAAPDPATLEDGVYAAPLD